MSTAGVVGSSAAPAYDPKLTLKAAAKVAIMAALGVLVADQSGLTSYLYQHVPASMTPIGAVLIAAAFAAARNFLANRNR